MWIVCALQPKEAPHEDKHEELFCSPQGERETAVDKAKFKGGKEKKMEDEGNAEARYIQGLRGGPLRRPAAP